MPNVLARVIADVEARAVELHARSMWKRTSEETKQRYRLAAAAELVEEMENRSVEESREEHECRS